MDKGVRVYMYNNSVKAMKMNEMRILYLTRTTSELFAPSNFGQHLHNN